MTPTYSTLIRAFAADADALGAPQLWRYGVDLAAGIAGLALWVLCMAKGLVLPAYLCLIPVYRGAVFIHELIHLRVRFAGRPWFIALNMLWNATIGLALLIPSLFYKAHLKHHDNTTLGTPADPQSLDLHSPLHAAGKVAFLALLTALTGPLRILVTGPVSRLRPAWREQVLARASSLAEPGYVATFTPAEKRELAWCETYMAVVWWTLIVLALRGVIPAALFAHGLAGLVLITSTNFIRVLGEHKHHRGQGPLNVIEDSSTHEGRGWHPLFPLGLAYHALHHLFPTVPYHNLGHLHRRLMNSPSGREAGYPRSRCRSLLMPALREAWTRPAPDTAG